MTTAVVLPIIVSIIFIVVLIILIVTSNQDSEDVMEPIPENSFPFEAYVINLDRSPDRMKYMEAQFKHLGITGHRWSGVDGSKISPDKLTSMGVTNKLVEEGLGMAGCTISHIQLWEHIARNKLDWTLILEDDAHFHPQFKELFSYYWNLIPSRAKIVYLGYCVPPPYVTSSNRAVIEAPVVCAHGYMLNHEGAQELLDQLYPLDQLMDIAVREYFQTHPGSYVLNGGISTSHGCPNVYKEQNGTKCWHYGIIYQDRTEFTSIVDAMDQ